MHRLGALTLTLALALPSSAHASGLVEGDYCNPEGTPRTKAMRWTPAAKRRTRDRIASACTDLGASLVVCAYVDAILGRESFGGEASVRHSLGEGENGLGPMGLSIAAHADKWPGDDEDPAFCTPEASLIVALEIMRRAVERWGAKSIHDVQVIYGRGSAPRICEWHGWPPLFEGLPLLGWLYDRDPLREECETLFVLPQSSRLGERMRARGFSEWSAVTVEDLGEHVPLERRREWAISQAKKWVAR